jgi:hypothetical protein
MQLKLFILPVKNLDAAEAEMNAFLRSHRVLEVKKELVAEGENSFWTFCVEYLEFAPGATGGNSLSGRPKVDYKELLKPERRHSCRLGGPLDTQRSGQECPMPLGFAPTKYARPGQVFVPEGHPIIAQRFNVGNQRP